MATLKWYSVGVLFEGGNYYEGGIQKFSGGSRTDPNALDIWAARANVFASGSGFDTKEEAVAGFASASMESIGGILHYIPERISYPALFGGPASAYLPDVSPSYSEYPFTVQAYSYSFTAYRGIDPPLYYTTLVIASGLSDDDVIPPPPPIDPEDPESPPTLVPITIQLKRDGTGTYSVKPSDGSVLTKYGIPFRIIRAKFNTTRVAVIEETIAGGFMIYEEVASAAVSPVYVYTSKRRLQEIITANLIPQYRATI